MDGSSVGIAAGAGRRLDVSDPEPDHIDLSEPRTATPVSNFADDPLSVLDGMSDPVVVVDHRMVITSANRAIANLVGVGDPAALIGHSGVEYVHEPDRLDAAERLAAFTAGRQPSPVSLRLARTDGSVVWVEITGAVVPGPTGLPRVVLGFRNVDWRHEADLDAARVVRRSHVLVSTALILQSVNPAQLDEALDEVVDGIGTAVGAQVVAVHEVEPSGGAMILRARWVNRRAAQSSAPLRPLSSTPLERVPSWVNALNSVRRGVELHDDDHPIHAELSRVEPAMQTGLTLSLYPGERLLGALTIGLRPGATLSSDERDFLDRAAEVLGVALRRVRDHQAMLESEAMFRALFEGSSAVMYMVDPTSLRILDANEAAADFYGYDRSAMAGMELHELTVRSRSELAELLESVRGGGTALADEQQRADGEIRTVAIHSTPMRLGTKVVELAIVQDVTEERRAVERLERLASTDDLTGAFNRRRFLQLVAEEINRAERYGGPFTLLMLDLDHFKSVNDSFGHLSGDAVLEAFAHECTSHLRAPDRFARMGGEEFAILLPETDLDDAVVLAERIRAATEKMTVSAVDGPPPCTVSIGAALWQPGWSVDELFARADAKLYEAKDRGRNRVEV